MEVNEFGVQGQRQAGVGERAVGPVQDARHAAIGLVVRRHRVVDDLEVVGHQLEVPVSADTREFGAAAQELAGGLAQAGAVILVVIVVADAVHHQPRAPACPGICVMLEQVAVALLVGFAVVGQVVHLERAAGAPRQEAVLARQHETALAEPARRDRGVLVGRDVPVPGNADLQAGVAVVPEAGVEETALAPVVQRKREPRRVEDRDVLEAQQGAARVAHALIVLQLEFAGLQLPVGGLARAGRVIDAVQDRGVAADQFGQLRAAVGAGSGEAVVDPGEPARLLGERIARLLPAEPQLPVRVTEFPGYGHHFADRVVENPFGLDVLVGAEQLDRAARFAQPRRGGIQFTGVNDERHTGAVGGRRHHRAQCQVRAGVDGPGFGPESGARFGVGVDGLGEGAGRHAETEDANSQYGRPGAD